MDGPEAPNARPTNGQLAIEWVDGGLTADEPECPPAAGMTGIKAARTALVAFLTLSDAASHGATITAEAWREAVGMADAWLAAAPDEADAHYVRASFLQRLGEDADALRALECACDLDPRDPARHLERARVLGRLGRGGDALAALDRAIALDDPDAPALEPWHVRAEHGRILGVLGRVDEAVADGDAAVRLATTTGDPDKEAWARIYRTYILRTAHRTPEAMADFARVLELRPAWAVGHYDRACALAEMGLYADALDDLREAIVADPSDAAAAKRDEDFVGLAASADFGPAYRALVEAPVPTTT